MAPKLDRVVTFLEGLQTIKSNNHKSNRVVLQGHVANENHYICTTRVPMATKLDRMITYLDGLLLIESLDPLITWSCDIT